MSIETLIEDESQRHEVLDTIKAARKNGVAPESFDTLEKGVQRRINNLADWKDLIQNDSSTTSR